MIFLKLIRKSTGWSWIH